jgi:glutamine amidotransferase
MDVAIIDYGMGNLRSVAKAFEHIAPRLEIAVTDDPAQVASAKRVVFPGQGAMPDCMRELDARGLRPAIIDAARGKPMLGICIGLQMLFDASDEGDVDGLGLMRGRVRRFEPGDTVDERGARYKVPHMGWNRVAHTIAHPLWRDIPDQSRFYFVHSYFVAPEDPALIAGKTEYCTPFTSAVARGNVFAVQFHPEKSGAQGLRLLSNFIDWRPEIPRLPA